MKIPLRVQPRPGSADGARLAEPLSFGVPVPQGRVRTGDGWAMGPESGLLTGVDATVLDRWPDGSARWVLIDAVADWSGRLESWVLDTAAALEPSRAVVVVDEPSVITLDTGAVRLVVSTRGQFPIETIEPTMPGPEGTADRSGVRVELAGADGKTATITVDHVAVLHRGRLRAAVIVEGTARLSSGGSIALTARIECFADSPIVRIRTTVRNPDRAVHPGNFWDLGDPGSVLIRDAAMICGIPGGRSTAVFASLEVGARFETFATPCEIYQDSSGGENWRSTNHINRARVVPTTFRGYRVRAGGGERSGLRATPAVVAESGGPAVGIAVPEFWQNFPQAIEAGADRLTVRFLPAAYADVHELQGGEQKTYECFLGLGPRDRVEAALGWTRQRAIVSAPPEHVLTSGGVDYLAPLGDGHRRLVDQAIDGPDAFERKREVIDEYGWRHFGEIYGDHEAIGHTGPHPLVSHYNNQYDPIAGFALQFLRTGDPRWWVAMDELARHVTDIDIYHTERDKWAYNGGLFWHTYHYGDADTSTHRTYPKRNTGTVHGGGPSADHNYPTGLVLRYFLTGDDQSREAAIGLARYVLNLEDWRRSPFRWLSRADTGRAIFTPPDFFGPARSSGNSLNALVDGHRLTGDPAFLAKADQLVCRVVHPKDDQKRLRLDEPEYRWFYAMFLQSLGKYLHHKAALGELDRAYAHGRASLLAYARWMADHEYPYLEKPERLEYPTETWAAQDIRKSDIFCHAAMHASGTERARFVERAEFFHRTSIETLLASPTRALARPVIVLLTSGILRPWLAINAGAAEPEPPATYDFGEPKRFVSQRAQAERRAKMIAGAGVLAALAALVMLAAWLIRRG